jgi:glycosyltransferase involved in cell wall biosynthesis
VPRVSVVIPVFNRAAVLPRAIDSVLSQDFHDFELIIVDDRSSDGSADVARQYDDERIRVLELEVHSGSNAARNSGIRAARGDLITFLDSDDVYLPHKLSRVVEEFGRRPDLDVLVDSFMKLVSAAGGVRELARFNPPITNQELFRRALFTRRLWKATPAISVRRSAALRVGLFDEGLTRLQDFDFLIRLSDRARCIAIAQVLWIKHETSHSISTQAATFVPAYVELCRKHPRMLSEAAYRPGMARDVARAIRRAILRGRIWQAARDLRRLHEAFGWRWTARLLREGQRGLPELPTGLRAAPGFAGRGGKGS